MNDPVVRPASTLWFAFPHEIIRSGIWKQLSKRAKAVYPVICTFADFKTGECYPSIRTLHEPARDPVREDGGPPESIESSSRGLPSKREKETRRRR